MPPETPVITREFLEAIGSIRSDIREIRTDLGHVSKTQEKQWLRIDEEVKERQRVDAHLLSRIDKSDGEKGAFKYVTPFIWIVVFAMISWAASKLFSLNDAFLVMQSSTLSKADVEEMRGAASAAHNAARAAEESQEVVREIQDVQALMQEDIQALKEGVEKVARKPVPKVPRPINKTTTVIVPAPPDYTFERLLPGATIDPNPPIKGGPRK